MAEDSNPQPVTPAPTDAAPAQGPQFALQRIYLKDSSFESPRSPAVFQVQWKPNINFNIKTRMTKVEDEVYEVVLVLTVEAKEDEQTAFLVEVHQAGIFSCRDVDDAQLERLLAIACPGILFPYARETIDGLVVRGSFPPLMLAPINFEVLYQQQKKAVAERAAANAASGDGAGANQATTPGTSNGST